MAQPAVGGDLVLAARPATAESWAPYGKLVWPGDRARLESRGAVLVALDARESAPRRVRHVQRYPAARRFLLSTGDASMALVVCGAGERPVGPAAAFRIPGGVGVVIEAGVWHAGPIPLADATILEAIETRGPADRLDRASVAEVLGAEGLRVVMPDEPGAPGPGLDLADAYSVRVAPELAGKVKLACLAIDRLVVGESGGALQEEGDRLASELRRQWGGEMPPSQIPGLEPVRDVYRALGIDPTKTRPSSEALLRRVLQGKPLYRVNALVDAMNLCSLRTLVPFGAYDRARIAGPLVLRLGREDEGYEGIGRGRIAVAGRPVLADREGAFGNPTADALRTRVQASTTRALVVLYLPPAMDDGGVGRLLDDVVATVSRHVGGEETGRRIVS
jgi:DNA/RNA-binding domain of Phe-tRNA-synthetase-like protein/ureidoglycolate hydrolase